MVKVAHEDNLKANGIRSGVPEHSDTRVYMHVCVICPSVYPQPSREQLIEHYLNSTQLEAALDTTFMG